MQTELLLPLFIFVGTLAVLGWAFWRARGQGEAGILSWLQLLSLIAPWLCYFGLSLVGTYISFALLLSLLILSAGAYILIGNRLRRVSSHAVGAQVVDLKPEEKVISTLKDDLKIIQGIFGVESFYATNSQSYREGVVFRGNLRADPSKAYDQLSKSLHSRFNDRYDLYLVPGQEQRPVVIVLPRHLPQPHFPLLQKILAIGLVGAGILTSLILGGQLLSIDILTNPERIGEVLPFALGLVTILGLREGAQRFISRQWQVEMSLPYLLPSLQIGSFGLFSRIQSPLPNRQALFDIAIAPAVVGASLSMVAFGLGLVFSDHLDRGIEVPSQIFQASILVGTIAKIFLGNALQSTFIVLHPLVIFGWLGMVITALNLLPAGQLDGGRIMQAIYGRQTAGWATLITLILLGAASILNPLALYWGGIIFVLLRDQERPMFNEISELDDERDAMGLCALFWMLVTLLPMTTNVASRLGIGSIS